jgi:hypothetical protein
MKRKTFRPPFPVVNFETSEVCAQPDKGMGEVNTRGIGVGEEDKGGDGRYQITGCPCKPSTFSKWEVIAVALYNFDLGAET